MATEPLLCVVEDDAFLQKLYKISCDAAQINAVFAANYSELQNILSKDLPTVILLDVILPNTDGFTVLKELKGTPETANIPVIVLSNLGQPEDKQKAMDLGAEDYLVKADISFDEIVAMLDKYFKA